MFAWLKRLLRDEPDLDLVPEEKVLVDEMSNFSNQDPDWERNSRIAAAQAFLKLGWTRARVVAAYGEDLTQEAERLLTSGREPQ